VSAGSGLEGPAIFTPEYYRRMRELEAAGWWNAGMREVASRLLGLADLPRSGTLLDVGCGSGQTMAWFRGERPGWSTLGIDVALDGLRAGRTLGEAVLAASALDLPVSDRSIDLAVTLDVLQHLPLDGGDERALAEMHRVLRPGGHLLARTNAQAFPVTPDDPDYSFHRYEAEELRRKLDRAGFTVLRLSRINALLGLAEIPRELRANRRDGRRYHGILARPTSRPGVADRLKRRWLALEGRAIARGWRLPAGRTLIALCRS
jgi:SAM-dependent methyltransferase